MSFSTQQNLGPSYTEVVISSNSSATQNAGAECQNCKHFLSTPYSEAHRGVQRDITSFIFKTTSTNIVTKI
jgi:hypothetical protein